MVVVYWIYHISYCTILIINYSCFICSCHFMYKTICFVLIDSPFFCQPLTPFEFLRRPKQWRQGDVGDMERMGNVGIICWLVVWNIFFPYIGNNNPNWLVVFRGVETTNQIRVMTQLSGWWEKHRLFLGVSNLSWRDPGSGRFFV